MMGSLALEPERETDNIQRRVTMSILYRQIRSRSKGLTLAYAVNSTGNEVSNVTWNRNANGHRLPTKAKWEYVSGQGQQHTST